ncbi:MAG: ATP-dependent helicase [Lachnospira sp.]
MNLNDLNDMQKRAVKYTEGPLLIIAGAGSGKTRVLTNRIAYLIDECGVRPYNILAITFTNKAAKEMRERVNSTVGDMAGEVWVSTFHSTCVRILRRYIDRLGYDTNFTIYDTDDQKSVIRDICKRLNIDTKMLKEKTIMNAISRAKDSLTTPDEMEMQAGGDYNAKRIAGVYREYQKVLKLNNALDFDDLIYKTVELFENDEEVLDYYQERFKYIMVDEYQDTNASQFKLISLLAGKYGNLCVVGDDDQSIYRFRGADITNILNFENTFKGTKVIKLEQNYRSTQNILNAANAVIKNNIGRKDKSLWTENGDGDLINYTLYENGYEEADGVVESISSSVRDGWNYNDVAILYRTNAQSRVLEEKLMMKNIPYRIYGGISFYQRKEIKDILAYLKTIDNGMDGQAVKRIINVPKRGIGNTTIDRVQEYADENEITFWQALCDIDNIESIKRGAGKVEPFVTLISGFKAKKEFLSIRQLTEAVIEDTHYMESLAENETPEETEARQENIGELINKIVSYEENCAANNTEPTLNGFLEEVALVADIDNLDESDNKVMLMTLHSAKGLEFPIVYMTGMEDGLFPSYMTIVSDDSTEIEEERRLCYVGITRAKKILHLSSAKMRMVRGETQMNKVSRFIKEIPDDYLHIENNSSGYNRGRIAYGGREEGEEEPGYNIRANAKAALNRYGSGKVSSYKTPERVKINGGSSASGRYSGMGKPSYATKTNYGSNNNTKVGFGKEFPMDLFNLKKSGKATDERKNDVEYESMTQRDTKAETSNGLGYGVGDTVEHVKFGVGKVISIDKATRDYMVTVEFEGYGLKKMLAGFARLKIKKS